MRSLVTRLKRLEQVRFGAYGSGRLQVQFGYLKELTPEYTGDRHIVTVGQLSNGHYQWEERPGAPRCPEEDSECQNLLRVVFVKAKDAAQENTL